MSPLLSADPAATLAYLDLLFGSADGGCLAVWTAEGHRSFANEEDRKRAASLVARLQVAIRRIAQRCGNGFETPSDLASVLRPVGAPNRNLGPNPALVRLIGDTGVRSTAAEIGEAA